MRRGGSARPIGDVVRRALRSLGTPSRAATSRVRAAWASVAEPSWTGVAWPLRLTGGELVIGVSAAALRHDLTQYHAARLLDALRRAMPDEPLAGLRFESVSPDGAEAREHGGPQA
jgi:hypothetical protein